ncbi:hypothetical protein [Hyalangium gracile]|uniref:hypothetical protein n=1 Tax=Hyalangium gracile TaxID=394092 RepID=UPI001CCDF0F3|nr:hypothetical protein [Hyalangium gracile]
MYAAIALGSLFISASQVAVAWIEKQGALENERVQQDREYGLKFVELVVRDPERFFGRTPDEQERMRRVITLSFPPDFSQKLFNRFEATASTVSDRIEWRQAGEQVAALGSGDSEIARATMLYIQYTHRADASLVEQAMSELRLRGYKVPGREFVYKNLGATLLYFHPEDEQAAKALKSVLDEFMADHKLDVSFNVENFGTRYPNTPKGIVEVWLPPIWPARPPQSAYCYQEEVPTRRDALKYSIYCQPTEQLCVRWRGENSQTRQSQCVRLEFANSGWNPQFDPTTTFWYEHRADPFPPPFPQLPANY